MPEVPPLDVPAARPRRRALRVLALVASLGLGAYVLSGSRQQLGQALDALTGLRPQWVVLGAAAEALSFVCLGGGLTGLLAGRPGVATTATIAVTAQGAANCLPAGAAVAGVVTYRQLRRRGAAPGRTASAVVLLSVLQSAALPLLALVGEQLSSGVEPVPGLRAVSAAVLAVLAAVAVLLVVLRRRRLPARALAVLVAAEVRLRSRLARLRRRPAVGGKDDPPYATLRELAGQSLSRRALGVAAVLSLGFWLSDALCLATSFAAVGAGIPWGGLLVTYCAAQLASLLPFSPGGLGVVEGSLTVGLVAYGAATTSTLSAVLLYRLVSFWAVLPAAGLGWLALRRGDRERHQRAQP